VDIPVEYIPDKMRSDFGDIRFTGDDGSTQLSYHLSEKVDGDNALFVVKIPSIAQSPSETTIYMYTGNSNATTTSNPHNVYIIYDDFLGEDNWNDLGGGEHSISEGQLILSDNGSEGVVYHDTSIPNDIEFKFIVDSASASYWADSIIYHNGSTIQYGYMLGFHRSDSSVWKGTGSYTLIRGGWAFGSCCDTVRIVRFGTKLQAYKNDVKKLDITDSTFSSGGKIAFRQLIGRDKVINEVSVRKRAFYPPGSIELIEWETSVVEDSDELLGQIEIAYYNIDLIGLIVVQQNTNNNLPGFLCVAHPYHELNGSLAVRLILDADLWPIYMFHPISNDTNLPMSRERLQLKDWALTKI
jgi:hypothetical protein